MADSASAPEWFGKCEYLRITEPIGETSNPFQAILDIAHGTYRTLFCYRKGFTHKNATIWGELHKDASYSASLSSADIGVVLLAAIAWTIFRWFLVNYALLPFARKVGVLRRNVDKFAESAWKFTAYSFLWSSAFYVTFYRGYDFFHRTVDMYFPTAADRNGVALDLRMVYALEVSFYLHSIFATLYMDVWRKDSVVMLVHHLVTLGLVIGSYSINYLKIGVLIFVLDDISDVILELGKVATYMRNRESGHSRFFSILCEGASVAFAAQWVVLRLLFHLTKVWRAATIGVWYSFPVLPCPGHLFFIVFLGSLYVLYCYWFVYIVLFVVRVLSGKQGAAEDPREEDAISKKKRQAITTAEASNSNRINIIWKRHQLKRHDYLKEE